MIEATLILSTIRAGFEFGTQTLKYLQTETGREFAKQVLADRAKWDSFWLDIGKGLEKLFSGAVFKQP